MPSPSHPLLYEINTRVWLRQLTARQGRPVTLANIPDSELVEWQRLGFTHIWLMGIWTGGPRSRAKAMETLAQREEYVKVLQDLRDEDIAASPYSIADYLVPEALGGEAGLQQFRRRLNERGIKLILDFVPNHLGLDHPWLSERPELFVQSPAQIPGTFLQKTNAGDRWLAYGKDPYFSPWTDTVQLDYRPESTREAMAQLLQSNADRCDGVRCDMAMLVLNDVFAKTWQALPVPNPGKTQTGDEFWARAISRVKKAHPDFLFLAETYWGLEPGLQELGFDYTYDKTLYDHLVGHHVSEVQSHLFGKGAQFVAHSAHFLENHDEPRIGPILNPDEHRTAALLILGLPGMRFLHQGQLTGATRRIPVQLIRAPDEPTHPEIQQIYEQILTVLSRTAVGRGNGELLQPRPAWPGNPTAGNIVLVQWQTAAPEFDLVVVNLAPHGSQCYAPLMIPRLTCGRWRLGDLLGTEEYMRETTDLKEKGLFLDLPAHAAQLFQFVPA